MKYKKDLSGEVFGKLTVVCFDHMENGKKYWKCKCVCGNEKIANGAYLKAGNTKSCGCASKEALAYGRKIKKKPHRDTRLYKIWLNMKQRCTNPKIEHAKYYVEKGIGMCKEWKDSFDVFYEWAVSNGYKDNLTIDRIDNEKDYSPSNCRWVDMKTQCNNRSNNRCLEYQGEKHTLAEWANILGFKYQKLYCRIEQGWDIERAFTTP